MSDIESLIAELEALDDWQKGPGSWQRVYRVIRACFGPNVDAPKYVEQHGNPLASIDAALTLVEEGAEYDITNLYGVAHVEVGLNFNDRQTGVGRRKDGNVVLALCQAALKARRHD